MWELWNECHPESEKQRAEWLKLEETVLYADSLGSWAPLPCLYWSNSALVSTHPIASSSECSTMYCPNCFTTSGKEGRCSSCLQCPVCSSTLHPSCSLSGIFHLRCSHCRYDSRSIDLSATTLAGLTCAVDALLSPTPSDDPLPGRAGEARAERLHQREAFAALLAQRARPPLADPDTSGRLTKASWQPEDADKLVAAAAARVPLPPSPRVLLPPAPRGQAFPGSFAALALSPALSLQARCADPAFPRLPQPLRRPLRSRVERYSKGFCVQSYRTKICELK